jgi:hypothetical protein
VAIIATVVAAAMDPTATPVAGAGGAGSKRPPPPSSQAGEPCEGHHSWPEFLGGPKNQNLANLSRSDHQQLHRDLTQFLKGYTDEFGNTMSPSPNNSGATIRQNFSPASRWRAMHDFYSEGPGAEFPDAAQSNTDTVVYTYDALNRVIKMTVNGVGQSIGFDALGGVTSASNPLDSFTYSYSDGTSRITGVSSNSGPTAALSHFGPTGDELLEQLNTTTHSGGTSLAQFGYTYNADDNVKTLTVSSLSAQTSTYAYDTANRMISALIGTGSPQYVYGYDHAANLTSITPNGPTESFSYGHRSRRQCAFEAFTISNFAIEKSISAVLSSIAAPSNTSIRPFFMNNAKVMGFCIPAIFANTFPITRGASMRVFVRVGFIVV